MAASTTVRILNALAISSMILCVILITGCAGEKEKPSEGTLTNTTGNEESAETTDLTVSEETTAEEQATSDDENPSEEGMEEAKTPILDIRIGEIALLSTSYSESEIHELKMIIPEEQQVKIDRATLAFTPCPKPGELVIAVNGKQIGSMAPVGGQPAQAALPVESILAGPNSIAIKGKPEDICEFTEVKLILGYADTTKEEFPAGSFILEPGEGEFSALKNLEPIALRNADQQVFSIKKESIPGDVAISLDQVHAEGKLIILLNDKVVYSGIPEEGEPVIIPKDRLINGKNTILFVGVPE